MLRVCGLDAVSEVGFEEGDCLGSEVEVVSEFVEEFGVRDCVVGFGEVNVDGECWVLLGSVFVDLVNDSLQCKCGAGVWSERVLRG